MDNPLITVEITDCPEFVASLILALNKAQTPAEITVEQFGADRTLTIVKLHGGY